MVVAIILFASSVIMLGASVRYLILSSTPSPAIGAIFGRRITHYEIDNAGRIEVLRESIEFSTKNLSNATAASDRPGCSKVCRKQYLTATLRVSGILIIGLVSF